MDGDCGNADEGGARRFLGLGWGGNSKGADRGKAHQESTHESVSFIVRLTREQTRERHGSFVHQSWKHRRNQGTKLAGRTLDRQATDRAGQAGGRKDGKLNDLEHAGQAVWLDFLDRDFLADGGLKKLVEEDGLTGVTSNPLIFEKAIGQGVDYDEGLAAFDKAIPGAPRSTDMKLWRSRTCGWRPTYCALPRPARRQGRLCQSGGFALHRRRYRRDDRAGRRLWQRVDRPNG